MANQGLRQPLSYKLLMFAYVVTIQKLLRQTTQFFSSPLSIINSIALSEYYFSSIYLYISSIYLYICKNIPVISTCFEVTWNKCSGRTQNLTSGLISYFKLNFSSNCTKNSYHQRDTTFFPVKRILTYM